MRYIHEGYSGNASCALK